MTEATVPFNLTIQRSHHEHCIDFTEHKKGVYFPTKPGVIIQRARISPVLFTRASIPVFKFPSVYSCPGLFTPWGLQTEHAQWYNAFPTRARRSASNPN